MSAPPVVTSSPQGVVRLTDWGLIRATGADARSFLQGQLTQDVLSLGVGQSRLAGYCSAKGRLLATFVVWPGADEELWLAGSADLVPAMVKRLSMYVLRARCKLTDASGERALWGRVASAGAGAAAGTVQPVDGGHVLRLPDARLGGQTVTRELLALPADRTPAGPALPPQVWAALEARAGVARVMAATSEQFVPQMVNLELVDGVSFHKGCYPGQEVVARSQYRGTLKRRAYVAQADVALAPGQELFHSEDPAQPAGVVVLAGTWPDGHTDALVELKIAATEGGTLHVGQADGPALRLDVLPYALPVEA